MPGVRPIFLLLAALFLIAPVQGQEPAPIPVQEALRDDNKDLVPDRLGETVTLVGVLTSDTRYAQRGSLVNFQDATGGILLYCRENARMAGLQRGDRVQARGRIGQYRGTEQLEVEEIVRLGEGEVPRPRDVRAVELLSERYSGQLVRVVGELRVPPNLLATLEGLTVRDRSGEIPVDINRRYLQDQRFVEQLLKGGRVELIGIARQSKPEPPYNSGYELRPRGPADFHFVAAPPYRTIGLVALALVVFGGMVHLWLRRRVAEEYAHDMQRISENLLRSEQALQASESRLRSIIETEPECVKLVAPDGTLLEMNPAGLAMIEAEGPADVVGKSVYPLVVPEHREAFRQLTESVSRGNKGTLEFEMVGLKGTRRWLETHAVPLRDGLEGHSLVLGVARDITERRQAEDALRASEEQFRSLFDDGPVAYHEIDREGIVRRVNQAECKLLGFEPGEILGRPVWELVAPEEREISREAVQRKMAGEQLLVPFTRRYVRRDGICLTLEIHETPLRDSSGNTIGIRSALLDITDRMRAEEALRLSEEKFANAFRFSPDSITISTLAEGRLIDVSDGFVRFSGYQREEVLGRPISELNLWADLAEREILLEQLRKNNRVANMEFAYRPKSGEPREALLSAEIVKVGGEDFMVAVVRDITERKQLEMQLRQSQKMEALGLLAGGIAHDFNNAAGAILGWAEMGLKEAPPDHPVHRRLEKIRDQARHTAELTRQLLAFASRQILEPRQTNLNSTVASVVGLLENIIGEDIEVRTALAADLWEVWADPSQFEQVLMNLCLNARDAMPQGGCLRIETQSVDFDRDAARHPVHVRAGRHVLLSVSDTGVGMDGAIVKRMFEPFYTTKGSGIGSGLGLAVVYGIVKQHDGFIYVSSEPGRGTTFRVYLPIGEGPSAPEPEAREPEQEPVRGGREIILVAEDHEGAREVAQETLENLGYHVVLARDGEEALRLFHEHPQRIGLVLLDVALPKISGPDLYTRIQAARPELPVVFITGYSTEAKMLSSLIEKGAAVLQKPYSPDELGQKVRATLDRSPALKPRP